MKTKPIPFARAVEMARLRDEQKSGGEMNLITVADAAKMLGVSRETVRRWVRGGRLKSFVRPGQGHRLFVERAAVEKFPAFQEVKRK